MCSVSCARVLLILFNFIFWLAGALLLALGIWMEIDPAIVGYTKILNVNGSDPLIGNAAILFIVTGSLMFAIGFLGCWGAIRGNQCLLFTYALLVFIIMALEITAAILVVVVYRSQVETTLLNEMEKQIKFDYQAGKAQQNIIDSMQKNMRCCGVLNYTDYRGSAWYNETQKNEDSRMRAAVPLSCCATDGSFVVKNATLCQVAASHELRSHLTSSEGITTFSDYLNVHGCYESTIDLFKSHTLAVIIVGFSVGAIEIFGLLAACCLRSALKRNDRTED